jgi:hypothetical protein
MMIKRLTQQQMFKINRFRSVICHFTPPQYFEAFLEKKQFLNKK